MTKKGKKTYKRYEDEFNYYTNGKVEATKTTLANLQHLYKKEKDTFESKFSKPKNESQTKYVSYLNNINISN